MSTIEMIRGLDRLRAVEDEWNAFSAAWRTPLLDHDWIVSCAETFHPDGTLRIATVRRGGDLQSIAPLALESTAGGARLGIVGASHLHEPTGWLCATDASVVAVLDPVLRIRRPLVLQRIPEPSPLCAALSGLTRRRAVTVKKRTAGSLAVRTGGSWETYREGLSSRITTNLPRLRRKAERAMGRREVVDLSPTPAEVERVLELVVSVEGSGWKSRRGSSLGSRPDLLDFFRRYCARAAARGRLRVAVLRFGDLVGAIEVAVQAYKRRWQLKIGYHEHLAPYYPGLQLIEAVIRDSFEQQLEAYEFLGTAEPWEERWRPETRNYALLAVYPLSAAGMIGACRDLTGVVRRRTQVTAAAWLGRA